MKNYILAACLLAGITVSCKSGDKQNKENNTEPQDQSIAGQINILGSESMYPLLKAWGDAFTKVYPNTIIKVVADDSEKGLQYVKEGKIDFAMVARPLANEDSALLQIPVARDAVVAIMNVNNPELQNIMNWGIDKIKFREIFVTGKINTWDKVYKSKASNEKINIYKLTNCALQVWAQFLDTKPEQIKGEAFDKDSKIINAVKMDRNSIGFINLTFAYDNYTRYEHREFKVIPIDFNSNELIDDNEFFYHNKDRLLDAIKDQRFARPPARKLLLVAAKKPDNKLLSTFIQWILSTGKNYVKDAGYAMLDDDEINATLNLLK